MYKTPPQNRQSNTGAKPKTKRHQYTGPPPRTRQQTQYHEAWDIPLSPKRSVSEQDLNQTVPLERAVGLLPDPRISSGGAAGRASMPAPSLNTNPAPQQPLNESEPLNSESQIAAQLTAFKKDILNLLGTVTAGVRQPPPPPQQPEWPRDMPPVARDHRPQDFQLPLGDRRNQPPFVPPNTPASDIPARSVREEPAPFREGRNAPTRNSFSPYRIRPSIVTTWGIRFSGSPTSLKVEDFLFRVERLAHSSGISEAELCGNLHVLLKDEAEDWFWNQFCRKNPNFTWSSFRARLCREFSSNDNTDVDLM